MICIFSALLQGDAASVIQVIPLHAIGCSLQNTAGFNKPVVGCGAQLIEFERFIDISGLI